MNPGDLITRPFQYELMGPVDGLVMGSSTPFQVLESNLGDMPEPKVTDFLPPASAGGFGGQDYAGVRKIQMKVAIDGTVISGGTPAENFEYLLEQLSNLVRPSEQDLTLTWLRPSYTVARSCVVKPRKREFPFDSSPALGWAQGGLEFWAYDPKAYSIFLKSSSYTLAIGVTSLQLSLTNAGTVGTGPIIVVNGASLNPRFTNADDENRTMKFNVNLLAGQQMVIDSIKKTVTIDGVDRYDVVAPDNQWWEIVPGANRVVYNRTGSAASSTALIEWRDAYL